MIDINALMAGVFTLMAIVWILDGIDMPN